MRDWFTFRFLYGTSRWNAAVLLLLLLCYVAFAYWLKSEHIGSTADALLLGGFVLLLLIGVMLYYGSRQATMSRMLDAETLRADTEQQLTIKLQEALLQQPLPAISNMGFRQGSKFATAICGYIDPGTLEVTYATAGHPPAILVDKSGTTRLLEYDGLPLGVERGSLYRTFKLTADRDSLLVLYTDGLLEYEHDVIEGERRMLEAARNIVLQRLADPAGAIEEAIFKDRKPLDDVAILTIAFRDCSNDGAHPNPSENWSVGLRGLRAPYRIPEMAE